MAFEPERDDVSMLRATIQLLVVQAQRRVAHARGGDPGIADRKIAEACKHFEAMQYVLKAALSVRAGASKVVTGLEGLHACLAQVLLHAQAAIRASGPSPT